MACKPPVRTLTVARYQPVWSTGDSTGQGMSDVFVFTGAQLAEIAPLLAAVRGTLTVDNRTVDAELEVVMQKTLDGKNWTTVPLSQGWVNTNGPTITPWHTTTTDFERGVRFGVRIRQASGINTVQMARVTLVLDLELKS